MTYVTAQNLDEDLFENMDNWMSWPDESEFFGKKNPLYGKHAKNLMKTDVRETEDAYEVDIDLPGSRKTRLRSRRKWLSEYQRCQRP